MKKKFLLIGGALAVGALALSSCGGTSRVRPEQKKLGEAGTDLDIQLTYSDHEVYITAAKTFVNPIDKQTYTANQTLLPAWDLLGKKVGEKLGVGLTIHDGIEHKKATPAARFEQDLNDQFKTTNANRKGEYTDLYQNTTENINTMGEQGKALNLLEYLDYMPNFKKYLEDNPVIEDQITYNGKIYYTPYMDGSDYYERMYQMDAYVVEKLLKNGTTAAFDETPAINENRIAVVKATPFIDATKNYASTTKVKISVDSKAKEVTIGEDTNIIKQQNDLLATSGTTGKQLAVQFINYLNKVYGNIEIKDGVKYSDDLSKVFIGESAIYNADDLVALFRVMKANPSFISNGKVDVVYPFVTRTNENNRVENVLGFVGNLFGIQGMQSENDRLFFGANGSMNDATTAKASYEGLDRLAGLYEEGMIVKDFYKGSSTIKHGEKYFQRSAADSSYGLLMCDYTAVPSKFNAVDSNNVGTSTHADFESSKVQPVLAPLTYWATESYNHDASLMDRTGKTLIRYFEENRSLKPESWCIPSNSDNPRAAVELMDYLMSKEGTVYNDFCDESYWQKDESNTSNQFKGYQKFTYGIDTTPQLSQEVINWYAGDKDYSDFWKFCRGKIGTTFGIGYLRTSTIDYQSTNMVARQGADALKAATAAGVNIKPNLVKEIKFNTTVPAAGYPKITDNIAKQYDAITQFWGQTGKGKQTAANGYVAYIVAGQGNVKDDTILGKMGDIAANAEYSYGTLKSQMDIRNKQYLYQYAKYFSEVGDGYGEIPSYAKEA